MREFYTITELTREFQVTTRTLRYYEAEDLIHPIRRGRQRLYPARERTRLMLILRGKRLGLSLAQIREIVEMYRKPPGEAGQLRLLLTRIEERREELRQKQRDIMETLGELEEVETVCQSRLAELSTPHAGKRGADRGAKRGAGGDG